ncbi:YgiQ family radical SAM protein [candidate division KSB1 bacterium 4484_87]|nr:MAG: YgiQ family radical SAM protein [candidate division KSB1 bacterium 4484_87]
MLNRKEIHLKKFLPMSREEMELRGWDELDIILVTGDAYVDHPSFGIAIIGRVLEKAGFRVGIIAMPDYKNPQSMTVLGKPRLFFGVSSGNVDSMVSNFTSFKMRRHDDPYAPGGVAGHRPNRAVIVYSNLVKQVYKDVPIVIGGIEASMRRMVHYDFWSDKLRRSILLDSRADILVYGMGEKAVTEIALRLASGKNLSGISGTVIVDKFRPPNSIELIPANEAMLSRRNFYEYFDRWFKNRFKIQTQISGGRYLIHYPPSQVSSEELDHYYELAFTREPHPKYQEKIPAFEMVQDSITCHRGCVSGCSFCALTLHQGKQIVSRSKESILREIGEIRKNENFRGHIRDIGGPSANNYAFDCRINWNCPKNSCITNGKVCKNLKVNTQVWLDLLDEAERQSGVKKVTVGSGIRYDLFMHHPDGKKLLKRLIKSHISGQLKIAPEHNQKHVLAAMNKEQLYSLDAFVELFAKINKELGKSQYLIPYLMSCHPGTTLEDMKKMRSDVQRIFHFVPDQVQAFIPLPMTISSVQYYTGLDPLTGKKVFVERDLKKRREQHRIFFSGKKKPKKTKKR